MLLESARISNFKVISRGNRRFCSTSEMPKCLVLWAENTQMFEVLPEAALEEYLKSTRSQSWADWIEANKAKAKAAPTA